MAPPQNTRQPTMKDQEHTSAPEFCSEAHRQERYDNYGSLLSALFEGSPSGASGFVTSTPKQTRAAPGNSDSARTVNDAGDNASPFTKEKRRYGKEWSLAAPRNRRNTSLGGVSLKASPSPSSVSDTFAIHVAPTMCLIVISAQVNAFAVHQHRSRTMVLEGFSVSVVILGLSGFLLLRY